MIKVGQTIKTLFLTGIVEKIIDGRSKGWRDTAYYIVRVTQPRSRKSPRKRQIVRLDEIKEVK